MLEPFAYSSAPYLKTATYDVFDGLVFKTDSGLYSHNAYYHAINIQFYCVILFALLAGVLSIFASSTRAACCNSPQTSVMVISFLQILSTTNVERNKVLYHTL